MVVRAVRAVGQQGDFEGRELLLEDLCDLLCRLADKVLAGNHSMQVRHERTSLALSVKLELQVVQCLVVTLYVKSYE